MANIEIENFDSDQYEPISFGPIPPGDYELMISNSEVKSTNKGDGKYASFDFIVLGEGEYRGRHVFQNVTLQNPSEKAAEIGKRQLSDLCRAVGKTRITDTDELHNIPFHAKVGIEPGKNNFGPRNRINKFYLLDGYEPAEQPAPAQAPQQQQTVATQRTAATATHPRQPVTTGAGGKPPWARNK